MLSVADTRADGRTWAEPSSDSLTALVAFDRGAWDALFDHYHPKLYRFAYARTGDRGAAEEIAADVFVAAARGISSYRARGAPFGAWLFRIARNLTADHLDRRRRRPQVSIDSLELVSASWDADVDSAADIGRALDALTDAQREVLVLRFFGGCSLEEAAGAMGKRVGAVKVLQHRALVSMRRELTRGGTG